MRKLTICQNQIINIYGKIIFAQIFLSNVPKRTTCEKKIIIIAGNIVFGEIKVQVMCLNLLRVKEDNNYIRKHCIRLNKNVKTYYLFK